MSPSRTAAFYEHAGVDPQGILRALTTNLTGGGRQGASTLTQQYVANVVTESLVSADRSDEVIRSGQKTIGDKIREIKLAIELEKKYTKDQILEGYLNIVFFNRDAYGIEAAARYFYSTTAKDLTLPQAALLAGLVNSPSFYDPVRLPGQRPPATRPGPGQNAQPGDDPSSRIRRRHRHRCRP